MSKYRTPEEIEDYLDHFCPKISKSTAFSAYLLSPYSLFMNVFFIIYAWVEWIFQPHGPPTGKDGETTTIDVGNRIIVWFEFCGLMFFILLLLIMTLIYKDSYVGYIDSISSWSTFKLFNEFRPSELVRYYYFCFQYRSDKTSKISSSRLIHLNKIKKKLEYLISNNNDNDENEQEHEQKDNEDDTSKNIINTELMYQELDKLNEIIERETKIWQEKKDNLREEARFIQFVNGMTGILLVSISWLLLAIGIMSLLLKVNQLTFITNKDITEWRFFHYVALFGFCNQLWGMTSTDSIQLEAIYKILFIKSGSSTSPEVIQNMGNFDGNIKNKLCKNYGFYGKLVAMNLNSSILMNLLIKNPNDLTIKDAVHYKSELEGPLEETVEGLKLDGIELLDHEQFADAENGHNGHNGAIPDATQSLLSVNENNVPKDTQYPSIGEKWHQWKHERMEKEQGIKDRIMGKFNKVRDVLLLRKYQQPIHPYHASQKVLSQLDNAKVLNQMQSDTCCCHVGDIKMTGLHIFENVNSFLYRFLFWIHLILLSTTLVLFFVVGNSGLGMLTLTYIAVIVVGKKYPKYNFTKLAVAIYYAWIIGYCLNQQDDYPDDWTIEQLWYHRTAFLIAILIPSIIAIIAVIVFIISDFASFLSILITSYLEIAVAWQYIFFIACINAAVNAIYLQSFFYDVYDGLCASVATQFAIALVWSLLATFIISGWLILKLIGKCGVRTSSHSFCYKFTRQICILFITICAMSISVQITYLQVNGRRCLPWLEDMCFFCFWDDSDSSGHYGPDFVPVASTVVLQVVGYCAFPIIIGVVGEFLSGIIS